jgi:predicted RNase H-like nuclease (RuvC/YqgF family)
MLDWLKDPGVVVGALALVGVLASPFVNARIKRKENGRIAAQAAAAAAESQRIEATEKRLRDLLDRQANEIAELRARGRADGAEREALEERLQTLERGALRAAQRFDRVLAQLLDEARSMRDQIREHEEHDEVLPSAEKLVKAIRDARGEFFNGEKTA